MERRLSNTLDVLDSLQPFHTTPLNSSEIDAKVRARKNSGGAVESKGWAHLEKDKSSERENFPKGFPAEEGAFRAIEPITAWEHVLVFENGGSRTSTSTSPEDEGGKSYDPFEGGDMDELDGDTLNELDEAQDKSQVKPTNQPEGDVQNSPLSLPHTPPPQEPPRGLEADHPTQPQPTPRLRFFNPLTFLSTTNRAITRASLHVRAHLIGLNRANTLLRNNFAHFGNLLHLHAELFAAARREWLLTRITGNQADMLAINAETIHNLNGQIDGLTSLLDPLMESHRLREQLLARLREVETRNQQMEAQKAGERQSMLMAQQTILELIQENRRLAEVNEEAVQGFNRVVGENAGLRDARDEAEDRVQELEGETEGLRAENLEAWNGLAEMDGAYAALRETYAEAAGGLKKMVEEMREGPLDWTVREGFGGEGEGSGKKSGDD
ncbi:hypothetical protein BU16DRAFT_566256 [Lophium mytilinum]|uniref:Uncharacterized protein n=1 Tax=Lophium mytilinum TaxID=390894 RepID=A0A6A6QCV1_9PEZI|nr:hypothetical protein BU16DRAFT_566256 [Lophium mytilinum]